MNGHMDTQLGRVSIDPEVIATYAGSVAVECFGIVGMAAVNMKDGLVKLLKKDYLTHGINVAIDDWNIRMFCIHIGVHRHNGLAVNCDDSRIMNVLCVSC